MLVKDPDTGTMYYDNLAPWNFYEAAEMFIRDEERKNEECLPEAAWKSKEWPLSGETWRGSDENFEAELTGQIAIEFEKKRKEAQDKVSQERLPYRDEDDEVPF